MKLIVKDYEETIPYVKLYKDDLAAIIRLLSQNTEHVEVKTESYEFDDSDSFLAAVEEIATSELSSVRIATKNPRIRIYPLSGNVVVTTAGDDAAAIGISAQIAKTLRGKTRIFTTILLRGMLGYTACVFLASLFFVVIAWILGWGYLTQLNTVQGLLILLMIGSFIGAPFNLIASRLTPALQIVQKTSRAESTARLERYSKIGWILLGAIITKLSDILFG
jgi:hypothetical protein